MKRFLFIVFLLIVTAGSIDAAQKETDISRGHLWAYLIFNSKLHSSGFGIAAEYSNRYNYYFLQKDNSLETSDESQGFWMNEFLIGPMWKRAFNRNLKLSAMLEYRLQGLFLSGKRGSDPEAFWKHSLQIPLKIIYKLPFMSFNYRLILWNVFRSEFIKGGKKKTTDNEFLMRHMLSIGVPFYFYRKVQMNLGYEIFHIITSNEIQPAFYKHHICTGISFSPAKFFSLKLHYLYQMTYTEESENLDKEGIDHYLRLMAVYTFDLYT